LNIHGKKGERLVPGANCISQSRSKKSKECRLDSRVQKKKGNMAEQRKRKNINKQSLDRIDGRSAEKRGEKEENRTISKREDTSCARDVVEKRKDTISAAFKVQRDGRKKRFRRKRGDF